MARRGMPPALASDAAQDRDPPGVRCPRCGSGDLFVLEVARRGGQMSRAAYCAGFYDRNRRRFLRRSCGYAGGSPDDGVEQVRPVSLEVPRATGANVCQEEVGR
jgi:hypothetical protein